MHETITITLLLIFYAKHRTVDISTENEQKCFENPTYGGTSMTQLRPPEPQEYETPAVVHQKSFPWVKYTMYDAVIQNPASQEPTDSGQDYENSTNRK